MRAIGSHEATREWPRVKGWLAKAAEPAGYTTDFILREIELAKMQLWVGKEFAAVTQYNRLPLHNTVTVVLLGGKNMSHWFDDLMENIESWARDLDCQYVECHGRKAWLKKGEPRGYELERVTMRLAL